MRPVKKGRKFLVLCTHSHIPGDTSELQQIFVDLILVVAQSAGICSGMRNHGGIGIAGQSGGGTLRFKSTKVSFKSPVSPSTHYCNSFFFSLGFARIKSVGSRVPPISLEENATGRRSCAMAALPRNSPSSTSSTSVVQGWRSWI